MSRALHVANVYKVEWSDMEAFNHKPYEFKLLLNELGVDVFYMSDDYLDFEILKTEWEKAIIRLESAQVNHYYNPTQKSNDIAAILIELKCDFEKAIELFKKYLESAEPNDEWLHFSFF